MNQCNVQVRAAALVYHMVMNDKWLALAMPSMKVCKAYKSGSHAGLMGGEIAQKAA